MKCPFCKKQLNKNNGKHIYYCNKTNLRNKDDIKLKYIIYNYPYISQKNILYNDYIINTKSFNNLRYEYGISYRNINFLLDYYKIKKRSKKLSSKLSINKYKKTCLLKYGVDNISKLKNIKKSKSVKSKYEKLKNNIENNFKNYNWLNNQYLFNTIYNLYLNKDSNKEFLKSEYFKIIKIYNNYWNHLNDDNKNKIINKNSILLESNICKYLNLLNIEHINNFKIGKKIFDIKISNTFLIIEVNSDYWHANPVIYNNNDILKMPFKNYKAKDIWNLDIIKKKQANKNGYNILYIWENDIKNLKDNDILNFLYKKIINYIDKF